MCGIAAFFSRDNRRVGDGVLERAVTSMRHRGPDAAHCWRRADGRIGLGHARLSIIDLTTGDQPIANEDESIRIVVNGEFYEHDRIRRELEQRNHNLRTRSDSEIALHLYEESGVDCLKHLRGEFAFVLWDEKRETLFAARDRFGIKPLFYALHDGALYIASEVKALGVAGVPLRWDQESVFQQFFASVRSDRTLFEGVRQVPPGHYLLATEGAIRVIPYWDLDYPRLNGGPVSERTEKEWVEQLRARVVDAVRVRMRADVPVGCLLSGGLDSSAMLGLARSFSERSVKAFTIAFDHPAFDESDVARHTAEQFGAEFYPIRVTNRDFAEVFADAVYQGEGIHYNAHGAARYLLSRAVRDAGVKVVLAGEGADELSAGYRFCEKSLMLGESSGSIAWPDELQQILHANAPSAEQIAAAGSSLSGLSQSLGFPEPMVSHIAGKLATGHGLLNPQFVGKFGGYNPHYLFFRQFDVGGQLEGREPIKQVLYLWLRSGFANYILGGERLDMAHAVEQRLPFLDHPLFELAREIPSSLMTRQGLEKWILRETLRPFVTDQVYRGRKRPFLAPPSVLTEGSAMLALAQDVLRSDSMATVPFFDHRAVIGLLDRLGTMSAQERASLDTLMMLLLSVGILHQRYGL